MPSRVVTKRRVKRRQQRLVSKNVKRKGRTVRTLRKHRKSVKKVMRGGEPPIIHEIFLADTPSTPVIKLTISKKLLFSGKTFDIEINLDLYKGDVRTILKTLFLSNGGTLDYELDDKIIKKQNRQQSVRERGLVGLADKSEQEGTINWTTTQDVARVSSGKKALNAVIELANKVITDKCFIKIETSTSKEGTKFKVINYSRIFPNKYRYDYIIWDNCVDTDGDDCVGGNKKITEELIYPVLEHNGKAQPLFPRISFILWSRPTKEENLAYYNINNEREFINESITDIERFVKKLKRCTILNLDGQDAKDLAEKDLAAPKLPETITADTSKETDDSDDKANV